MISLRANYINFIQFFKEGKNVYKKINELYRDTVIVLLSL
jgi:hypothetical protein